MRGESVIQSDSGLDRLLADVRKRLLIRRMGLAASRNLLVVLLLVLPAAVISAFRTSPHLAGCAAILCAAALAAAGVESLIRRPGLLDAALHIDRRLRLDERLSTLVNVPAAADRAMLAALMQDTVSQIADAKAADACPLSFPRSAPFTGAALFVVAALIFGAGLQGSAETNAPATYEIREMTVSKSYARVVLPADLQKELAKLAGPGGEFDEALARLDSLLNAFEALDDFKNTAEELKIEGLTADDIKAALEHEPDARKQLEAALYRAARGLSADRDLRAAVEQAAAALEAGDDAAVAEALAGLIDKLAEVTSKHQLEALGDLKERLAEAEATAAGDEGVVRRIISGGSAEGESGPAHVAPLFPIDAALEARAAIETESVPARYRWAVERYFQDE